MLSHPKNARVRRAWLFAASLLLSWGALGVLATFPDGEHVPIAPGGAAAIAHAQDAPAPGTTEAPAGGGKSVLSNVAAAGWIGVVIILCSIVGFSLAITFAFQLRRDTLVPPEVLGQVEQCFEEENYEEAFHVCEAHPSLFSTVMAAGLAKIDRPYEEIENAMIDSGDLESNKLHQKVGWLSLIAAIAPMLGLFGTVYGMIVTFNTIAASATQPKPAELADGISLALVTTFMGLLVAIPMTVLFVVFRNKVVNILLEVGAVTEELMDRFKGNK